MTRFGYFLAIEEHGPEESVRQARAAEGLPEAGAGRSQPVDTVTVLNTALTAGLRLLSDRPLDALGGVVLGGVVLPRAPSRFVTFGPDPGLRHEPCCAPSGAVLPRRPRCRG